MAEEHTRVAGRGVEFSASHRRQQLEQQYVDGTDFYLPLKQRIEDSIDDELPRASKATPIPSENVGYKLLMKMGWEGPGRGLGKNSDGRQEPVDLNTLDAGLRLGLGKMEQDSEFTCADNINRKQLEVEIQLHEDDERREQRLDRAEQQTRIQEEVKQIMQTFYCDVCDKQYKYAAELEEHLSSYSHHHTKRLREMKKMQHDRTRTQRERKALKSSQREMARINKQIAAATGVSTPTPLQPPLPPEPPQPSSTPPPPAQHTEIKATGGWSSAVSSSHTASATAPDTDDLPNLRRGGWQDAGTSGWRVEQQADALPSISPSGQRSGASAVERMGAAAEGVAPRRRRWDVTPEETTPTVPDLTQQGVQQFAFSAAQSVQNARAPSPGMPPLPPDPPAPVDHAPPAEPSCMSSLSFSLGAGVSGRPAAAGGVMKQTFSMDNSRRDTRGRAFMGFSARGKPLNGKVATMFGDDADDGS